MSITLSSPPPAYAFSGDRIRAGFVLGDIYEQAGAFAINKITLDDELLAGDSIFISWGSKQVTFVVSSAPNDSGTQLQARSTEAEFTNEQQADLFRSNYDLQNDFVIAGSAGGVNFFAKNKGSIFNISGFNVTPGEKEILRPNLQVKFMLYCEDPANINWVKIYESILTVNFGDEATAEAVINDKLDDYIMAEIRNNLPDIPDEDPLLCRKSCRRYYFEYAEMYGDIPAIRRIYKSDEFTVLHGGLSAIGQSTTDLESLLNPDGPVKRFLKQGGAIQTTRSNQNQYLYFFNTGDEIDLKLKCRLRFTDGTKTIVELHEFTAAAQRKYGFNVSYDAVFDQDDYPGKTLLAYEFWMATSTDSILTETQTYLPDYRPLEYLRYFQNWSSWGTMDSRAFYGKSSLEFDLSQEEAEKADQPLDITKGNSLVFNLKLQTKFSVATGFFENRRQLLFNRDFFLSPLKWRQIGSELLPLKVTSKTISELQDGNNLLAQKFEYQYLFFDHAYTEGDIQEPGITFEELPVPYSVTYLTNNEQQYIITLDNFLITI